MRIWIVAVIGVILFLNAPKHGSAQGEWFIGVYGAKMNKDSMIETLTTEATYVDSYFIALNAGKALWSHKNSLCVEGEGQIVTHWGKQDHLEFNSLLVLRWHRFPWNHLVTTSFAVGEGISYATEKPHIEAEKMDDPSNILNYMMLEWTFAIPGQKNWHIVTRLHHRSGVFGTFNGVDGGSNAIGMGLRYTF